MSQSTDAVTGSNTRRKFSMRHVYNVQGHDKRYVTYIILHTHTHTHTHTNKIFFRAYVICRAIFWDTLKKKQIERTRFYYSLSCMNSLLKLILVLPSFHHKAFLYKQYLPRKHFTHPTLSAGGGGASKALTPCIYQIRAPTPRSFSGRTHAHTHTLERCPELRQCVLKCCHKLLHD